MPEPRRLHRQHFIYLRACAEGLPRLESAKRFLGIDDGRRAQTMHRAVANDLRALAKRLGERDWRFVGTSIPEVAATSPIESLSQWAEANQLLDWSESELLEMYQANVIGAPDASRRQQRNMRVRQKQLDLLRRLEPLAATPISAADPIDAWLPDEAGRLALGGLSTMGDIARAIASGRQWWRAIPGFGTIKAGRIAAQLQFLSADALLPHAAGGLVLSRIEHLMTGRVLDHLDGSTGNNRSPYPPRISASDDRQAIDSWLKARAAGSDLTALAYRREAERFLLWCVIERNKPLSSANVDDCGAYLEFLGAIPAGWVSREKAARFSPGWTPFRGQLSPSSRRHAIGVVNNLFEWLTGQRYLDSNPWMALNRASLEGAAPLDNPASRALTTQGYGALLDFVDAQDELGAGPRNRFLLRFLRHTGLRISELIYATLADLHEDSMGFSLQVIGKGRRRRLVTLSEPAIDCLSRYLTSRALPFPPRESDLALPILVSVDDPHRAVGYESLYSGFRELVRRASKEQPARKQDSFERASLHWLRHTFATRAAEAGMPEDVLMAEMGHRSRETTARYYTSQGERRRKEMEKAAAASE